MKFNNSSLALAGASWKSAVFLTLSCMVWFRANLIAQSLPSPVFRASVVKINITPDKPKQLLGYGARVSSGVHDSIYHRIVALDDGRTQFFLVSTEICLMSPSLYDEVAANLKQKLGIEPVNFWWSVTHTHSAPEVGVPGLAEVFLGDRYKHPVDTEYTAFVEKTLFDGIVEARRRLEPARLGIGWGYSQANINRRAVDVDGRASLGLNPDGPVDRRLGLIRLEKLDRSPLALIVNYPIHGTVLGGTSLVISGDAPGVVSDYVEEQTGATTLFINGAAGNIAPIYSVYPSPQAGHLSQFRVLLGDRILEANRMIGHTQDTVRLFTGSLTVESPRKPGLGWPSYLGKYSRTEKNGDPLVRLPVRFLRLNEDLAIWSAPLELFCEISNEVRDRSPFPFTLFYGYTNGWLGYLPAENAWRHGGYEVNTVSPFTPAMPGQLTESVTAYLQGELRSAGSGTSVPNKKP
ncbi:MAG TPA: neutral/alkaline non-lysosomal ceramidase N-terminal domain-containing protein [Saprospiraceae bacterium]|nr:neutral/alkaline non-lysosomal ceramidase N-terminal domain-containing protein [Saprospiraceae bacterium]